MQLLEKVAAQESSKEAVNFGSISSKIPLVQES
jgi:hypothetical protein